MASRSHRKAHKRGYVGKTSSKIRKGYRHGEMRKRRKAKNAPKKALRLQMKRRAKAARMTHKPK